MGHAGGAARSLGMALLAMAGLNAPMDCLAQSQPSRLSQPSQSTQRVDLHCRLVDGPWRPCQLHMVDVGRRWWVEMDGKRWLFRHDGQGTVSLWQPPRGWTPIETHWLATAQGADPALCWDGLCALGPIPLD